MKFGDSSEEGQALEPTIIEFMVLTACLFNMEMEIFRPQKSCYVELTGTRLVKNARYMGSIWTCLLQKETSFGVNKACLLH